MIKLLKLIVFVALILIVAVFAYDLYMRNSGIENRIEYEKQKIELRQQDIQPVNEVLDANREIQQEVRQQTRQERRAERKAQRREKIRRFFNGE